MRRIAALGAATSALLVAKICLRVAAGRTVRIAARVRDPRAPRPVTSARIRDLCWAVSAIGARRPFFSSCLERGVALVMLLSIARIPANLVVGVTRAESVLRAHAWVESDGVVILGGTQSPGFTPLLRVPASRPSSVSASCPG